MTGSVAATIQGEAGSNPASQFAVAATIYNRLKAGTYGSSAFDIVNAPNQFVGRATPNASAQIFAQAIENGTLPQFGNTGNAVNFQTAGSDTTLGKDPLAVNIGGNNFSDRFGTPTSNFVPPQFMGFDQNNTGIATDPTGLGGSLGSELNPITGFEPSIGGSPDPNNPSSFGPGTSILGAGNDPTNPFDPVPNIGNPFDNLTSDNIINDLNGSVGGFTNDLTGDTTGGTLSGSLGNPVSSLTASDNTWWQNLLTNISDLTIRGGLGLLALVLIGAAAWAFASGGRLRDIPVRPRSFIK